MCGQLYYINRNEKCAQEIFYQLYVSSKHTPFFVVWASCHNPLLGHTRSRGRCWAAIRLSRRPEPSDHAVYGGVNRRDIGGQHGYLVSHTHRLQKGHTPFVEARAETCDIGAEAIKPKPRCSWQGHSRRVDVDVDDESTDARSVSPTTPHSIGAPPRAPHFCCQMKWWVVVRRVQLGCLDLRRRAFPLDGQVSAEWSRCQGSTSTACWR